RWRTDDERPAPDEVRLAGPRVLLGDGHIIVPWSERVRYVRKKNGYHGGASPQEVIVPLAVLSAGGQPPPGWQEAPPWLPDWWEEHPKPPAPRQAVPARPLSQALLFEGAQGPAAVRTWIDAILESERYRTQRNLAGRNLPSDELVRRLLSALDAN